MSFICHIHNYTEYNQQWNLFSAFNPSKCTHTWSSGQPTLRRPGSSALLKGLTSVVDNSCRSRDSNPQPLVTSPTLYPLEPRLPIRATTAGTVCTQDCYACLNQCFVLFSGSVHSMCKDAQSRLAASLPVVNIWLWDRTGKLWWVTEQNKDGAKCGWTVLEGR